MKIRPAEPCDLPAASRLWRSRLALLRQSDPRCQPLPNAAGEWRAAAEKWIADEDIAFFVAELESALLGFAAVTVAAGEPGLHPPRKGRLLAMVVDLHGTHSGLSERLLGAVKGWLRGRGVDALEIDAPAGSPVEEAFWRAQRATLRFNRFWLAL